MIKAFILLLFFALPTAFAQGNGGIYFKTHGVSLNLPSSLSIKPKKFAGPSTYANADCIEIWKRNKKINIGLVCAYSNLEALENIGFSAPKNEDHSSGEKVAYDYYAYTPMMQYPMEALKINGIKSYQAEVDCDLHNGNIYRATGTCLSVIIFPLKGGFIYVDIPLVDNVKRKRITSKNDVLRILDGFKFFD